MRDYSRTEITEAIDEWIIGRNAHRDREVLKARLIEGLTYEALAEKFDMSVAQIKRIVYKTSDKLFRHLK
jgi:DNA-directed RNA polymerase specialized sigma24 family protein